MLMSTQSTSSLPPSNPSSQTLTRAEEVLRFTQQPKPKELESSIQYWIENCAVARQIPSELAFYLSSELSKYIKRSYRDAWVAMPPNSDTCIV
jgi:hypothetical protein